MLAGLRHHAVVGGHHQQRVLTAGDARHHVVDEAVVTGHVDEADATRTDIGVGEAQVDGQAATLFFRQAVGVDARKRSYDRRLAVIDVTSKGDDHRICLNSATQFLDRRCAAHIEPQTIRVRCDQ